jgi:hypothetical protein
MLNTVHNGHYMIYNLSERSYNYAKFGSSVVDVGFPDHHAPPLELLFSVSEKDKKESRRTVEEQALQERKRRKRIMR